MTLGAEGENHHGSGPIMKTFHKVLDKSSHVCSSIKGHECFTWKEIRMASQYLKQKNYLFNRPNGAYLN